MLVSSMPGGGGLSKKKSRSLEGGDIVFPVELVRNANVMILRLDKKGRVIFFNKKAEKVTGYKAREVLGKDWMKTFIPKSNLSELKKIFGEVMDRKRSSFVHTNKILTKSGEKRVIRWSNSVQSEGGQVQSVLSIGEDITEQVALREKLEVSLKTMLSVLGGMSSPVYVVDPATYEVLYANKALTSKFGDVIGKNCYKVFQGRKSPCPFCTNDKIFGSKSDKQYVWEHFNEKIGRWYQCTDRAIRWYDGRLVRYELAVDITPLKHAKQELSRSRETYRRLVQNSPDVIAELTLDGKLISASPALKKLTGHSPDDLLGKRLLSRKYLTPESLKLVKRYLAKTARGKRQPPYEAQVVCKDGSVRDVEINTITLFDDNEAVALQVVVRDITERKEAERALQESQSRFYQLFDNSMECIAITDLAGKVIAFNPAAEACTGYSEKHMLGKSLLRLWSGKERKVLKDYMARLRQGKHLEPIDARVKAKDGSVKTLEIYFFYLKDSEGNPVASAAVGRDITERSRLERELRKSEENYRALFDSANDMMFVHDAETGKILDVNNKVCDELGYKREKILGRDVSELSSDQPAYSQKNALKLVRNAVKKGPQRFEWLVKAKSGKTFWVEVNLKSVKIGEKVRVLAVARDIDENKRQKQKLAENERKLSAILNNVFQLTGVLSPDGTVLRLNRAAMDFVGASENELIGKKFWKCPWWTHSKKEQGRLRNAIQKAAGGETVRFETTHVNKHGQTRIIDFSLRPLVDDKGHVIELIPEGHDITSIKEAEKELSRFIENLPDIVFELSPDGRFIRVNEAFEKLTGKTREEVKGRRFEECGLLEEADVFAVKNELARFAKGEPTPPLFNLHVKDRSGRKVPLEINATRMEGRDGVESIQIVARDVSSKKKAEHAQKMFEELFNSAKDAIFISTYPSMKIVDVNPEAEKLTGYQKDEFLGKKTFVFKTRHFSSARLLKLMKTEVLTGMFRTHRMELLDKKGRAIPVDLRNSKFEMDGKTYVQTVVRDVSRLAETEKELRSHLLELEKFHDVAVGREKTIMALKKKIRGLEQ